MSLPVLTSPTAAADIRFVCSDDVLARRLEAALEVHPAPSLERVGADTDLGPFGADPVIVVLALQATPTARTASIRRAYEKGEAVRVVVCHETGGPEVRRALQAGAVGYVLNAELEVALVPTMIAVMAGQVAVPRHSHQQVGKPRLSPREKQILGLVVMGLMNYDIAKRLYLSESTVKSHLSSAFVKLGVRSRSEAVDLILDPEHGLGRGILAITDDQPPAAPAR
jgi:DNA-binding NarL/FixJ family response regulator